MKLFSVFRKSLLEARRDRLALALSLAFAPLFVLLYALLFPGGSTTYGVLVINQDLPAAGPEGILYGGEELAAALEALRYANGSPLLEVQRAPSREWAEARLRDRDAEVLLIIPPGFSRGLLAARQGEGAGPGSGEAAAVTFVGDLTNPYYALAAILAGSTLDEYVLERSGQVRPVSISEEALGASAARSEFELYVPGLLVFAVMMLVFQAAMMVTREVESGGLRRLKITRMSAFDFLGGTSLVLVLIGAISVLLTVLAAWALGFHSQGPLWAAVLVGAITSLSIIGAGLLVSCFARTTTQAFLIANFPLGLFMFFSGAIYPIPRLTLFHLGSRPIGLYDLLPPTHAVAALNKILTLGAGLNQVAFELAALALLSVLYFGAGVWLFQRTHLQAE
jgi:ABC-2 type transport system permease protein